MRTFGARERNDVCHPELARPNTTRRGVPPRPVVDPDGTTWPSLSAAARAYRLTYTGIRYRIKAGLAGWRWAEPQEPRPIPDEQDQERLIILLTRASWLARAQGKPDEAERLLGWARAVRDGKLP